MWNMKYKLRIIIFFLILSSLSFLLFFLVGCSDAITAAEKKIKVTIVDGDKFKASENFFSVEKGADISVTLQFMQNYTFDYCSYENYAAMGVGETEVDLVLKDIRTPTRVKIGAVATDIRINYNLNGGLFIGGEKTEQCYTVAYEYSELRRTNTSIGTDKIEREGHTLIGWNTKPDGSGEHIGLGSRVSAEKGEPLDLYAEWAKWLDGDYFIYEEDTLSDGITLTGYIGPSVQVFTIPAEIDGKIVKAVSSSFSDGLASETLILPVTVETIYDGAFRNSQCEILYLFDNVKYVKDESFGNTIKTLHLNAVLAPCFQKDNYNAQFADNMDRLIQCRTQNKLIFFGGCNLSYGLRSEKIDEIYGDRYAVLNMGVIGGINATFQFDCITSFVCEGDVFVHAPEVMSKYQLLNAFDTDYRIFVMVEGNYDLLTYADATNIEKLFYSLYAFNNIRADMEEGSYSDRSGLYNEYGDVLLERPYQGDRDISYNFGSYYFDISLYSEKAISLLCDYYDRIAAKKALVYFTIAPTNLTALASDRRLWEAEEYERRYRTGLQERGYAVISEVQDYLYPGRYFFDADYHLNEIGADLRTQNLINDLSAVL